MFTNILKLLSGNGLAQAIQLFALYFFSKLYSAEDFSSLSVAQSFGAIGAVIMTLQLHLLIPLSKDNDQARCRYVNVLQLSVILFVFLLPIFLFLNEQLSFGWVIAFSISQINIATLYFSFKEDFSFISKFYILRALIIVIFQGGLYLTNVSDGLLIGAILGELLLVILLIYKIGEFKLFPISKNIVNEISYHRSFSLYGSVQEILSIAAFYLPLYFLVYKYGELVSGNYAVSSRLIWGPAVLVSSSVANVLYAKFGQWCNREIATFLSDRKIIMLAIPIIVTSILIFKLDSLYLLLLGDEWTLGVKMFPWVILWAMFFIMSTPYRILFRRLGKQKIQFKIELASLVLFYPVLILLNINALSALICMCLFGIFQQLLLAGVAFNFLRRSGSDRLYG
ncbi:lipopolysaccharide biosynthesis protein [Vibrio sp. nBUS_14]|uniref:lipopolysaccharide biosynthesis protein n=1 Tax=Vibrio sp. nBUS_14 TaxID=3395321 RepID=UPI003EB9D9FC